MRYLLAPLRRYADFGGRSRRREYWLWLLFVVAALLALMYLDAALGLGGSAESYAGDGAVGFRLSGGLLTLLFALAMFVPGLAVSVRRLHDVDRSGWTLLLALIPFVNLYLLYLYVQPGTAGDNRYGPDPKAGDLGEVFA